MRSETMRRRTPCSIPHARVISERDLGLLASVGCKGQPGYLSEEVRLLHQRKLGSLVSEDPLGTRWVHLDLRARYPSLC